MKKDFEKRLNFLQSFLKNCNLIFFSEIEKKTPKNVKNENFLIGRGTGDPQTSVLENPRSVQFTDYENQRTIGIKGSYYLLTKGFIDFRDQRTKTQNFLIFRFLLTPGCNRLQPKVKLQDTKLPL